jgi:hypothetical protein
VRNPIRATAFDLNEKISFGYTKIMFKAIPRITAGLGYNLTITSGDTLILTPTQTTLATGLQLPQAGRYRGCGPGQGITWRTAWNYYDYNEKSAPGPSGTSGLPKQFSHAFSPLRVVWG